MKHPRAITFLILAMFLIAQLIGLFVIHVYSPRTSQVTNASGSVTNVTAYNLPYGMEPPQTTDTGVNIVSIVISFIIAITLLFVLMRFHAKFFLRAWFFLVVTLALGITITAFLLGFVNSVVSASIVAIVFALPLAVLKIYRRNLVVHNLTELLIYPGIAAIFVPLLSILTASILLVIISLYDMYMVWRVGLMQKMAKYQMETLRIFGGFLIPYISKDQKVKLRKSLKKSKSKEKQVKVPVGILGGGDVAFPLVFAGVVLQALGLIQALIIVVGATFALASLFYFSKKGKVYPAMPFISAGCFVALAIALII